jgi:two-component system chemotaxis response regulator CheY
MIEKGKKVLVVDDMKMARMLIIASIAELGLKDYVEAENGQIALDLANDESQNIGLIISDWNMPVMTGIDFLINLKKQEKTKLIPFVFVSAEGEAKSIAQAQSVGALEFIEKPINVEKLRTALAQLFKKQLNQ